MATGVFPRATWLATNRQPEQWFGIFVLHLRLTNAAKSIVSEGGEKSRVRQVPQIENRSRKPLTVNLRIPYWCLDMALK
jgi:hypothetical protein